MSDNSQNDETPLTPEQQENDFISILGEKTLTKQNTALTPRNCKTAVCLWIYLTRWLTKKTMIMIRIKTKTQETLTSRTIKATAFHSFRKKKRKTFRPRQ